MLTCLEECLYLSRCFFCVFLSLVIQLSSWGLGLLIQVRANISSCLWKPNVSLGNGPAENPHVLATHPSLLVQTARRVKCYRGFPAGPEDPLGPGGEAS